MEKNEFNWKDYHHQVYQIYHGMIAATLVPFILLFLQWDSETSVKEVDYSSFIFLMVAQSVWVIGYLSWYVWKGSRLEYEVNERMDLYKRLKEFKKKNLMKFGLLTLGGVIASFAMWLQPSFIFVIAYMLILVQFSFLRPSEDKIVRDMRLTKDDRKILHQSA